MFNNKPQVQTVEHKPQETSSPVKIRDPKQQQPQQQQHLNNNHVLDGKDLEQISKETQELRVKTRKLQLEVDEKNEIINVLKDELETTKEQSDKFQRENLQLLKDAKRVAFLQDENDFLQDKVGNVDKLELEIKRLKEKLQEVDFLRLRIGELEEDRAEAREESADFEKKWQQADAQLKRVADLEAEINKWKSFSHELEAERDSIKSELLQSVERENKLALANKQVNDEICRLRSVIKTYEDQQDAEQASNSLIMSVADLQQLDAQSQNFIQKHEQETQTGDNQAEIEREKLAAVEDATNKLRRELENAYSKQLTDLEIELNKFKTISQEVGKERDLIQDKLFEAIDRENRLNTINKDVDDEIARLKKLVKTYKDLADESKLEYDRRNDELNQLKLKNCEYRNEHECDKETISVLRQDLACEKNLVLKLSNKLKSFSKHMENIDKHFPSHEQATSIVTSTSSSKLAQDTKQHQQVPTSTSTSSPTNTTTTNNSITTIQESKPSHHNTQFLITNPTKTLVNGSHPQQQLQSSPGKSTTTTHLNGTNGTSNNSSIIINGKSHISHVNNSNFVRNSMVTRSVNHGQIYQRLRQEHHQLQQHQPQQQPYATELSQQQQMALHYHHHHQHLDQWIRHFHMHHHQLPAVAPQANENGIGNGNINGVGGGAEGQNLANNLLNLKIHDKMAFSSMREKGSIIRQKQQVNRAQITATPVNKRMQVNGDHHRVDGEQNHKKPTTDEGKSPAYCYGCV